MKKFVRIISLALVALTLCALFAACAPAKDPADAKAALEEAGYVVVSTPSLIDGCTEVVRGIAAKEYIKIYYFESTEKANAAYEKVEELYDEDEDEEEEDDSEWVFKKSGKIIYYGTKNAVKAAR